MTEVGDRFERCSDQADERGDPMLGTAFPASRLLLVEQPGPWGRAGLPASRFDSAIAHRLVGRLEGLGIRVLAIRRPGRHVPDGPRRWALVDCRPDRERIVRGRFGDERELLDLDVSGRLDRAAGEVGPAPEGTDPDDPAGPEYLVCAHGTHDACCAIRGRPLAAALEALRPGRAWECSHVGGDRFAANLLVLPSGLLYGRVRPERAADLVTLTDRGGVDPSALRGRVGFSSAEQAAMVLAFRQHPGLGWRDVRVRAVDRSVERRPLVTLSLPPSLPDSTITVAVEVHRAEPRWLTCQSGSPGRAPEYGPTLVG